MLIYHRVKIWSPNYTHGVGWRVTGEYGGGDNTARSVCVRTNDKRGVQFVFSCKNKTSETAAKNRRCPSLMIISCNHTSMNFTKFMGVSKVLRV